MFGKRFSRLIKIFHGTGTGTEDELFQFEGRLERFAHFWVLVIKNFIRNRCFIRASALAYTSLLALIPLLAVAVSVTTSLLKTQGEDKIYHAVDKFVSNIMPPAPVGTNTQGVALNISPGMSVSLSPTNHTTETNFARANTNEMTGTNFPVAATVSAGGTNLVLMVTNAMPTDARVVTAQKEAAEKIHAFIQKAQSATLGLTGMAAFVFIAIMMLSRVEDTFNDIWGVTRGRSWLWRIVLYWATITLGPMLIISALGLTGSAHFENAKNFVTHTSIVGDFVLQLLPLVVLCFTFALIYMLVPNTRVRFSAALVGGIVAGLLWHLNNVFGFLYVSRVATYKTLYGGIGLVPVFMLGLYFSWVILLFGAQIAHAFQNRSAYLQERLAENVNQRGREFVALRIVTLLGRRFQNGLEPATVHQLSTELGVPSRLAQQILQTLAAARLVTEVGGAETAYVPARPLDTINAHHVLLALRSASGRDLPVSDAPALAEIYGEFARIEEAERSTAEKISLLELVHHTTLPAIEAPQNAVPEKQIAAAIEEKTAPREEIKTPEPPADSTAKKTERPEEKPEWREVVRPEDRDFPL